MENIIKVGMADLKASHHPAILTTLGLGSCVGIALFDRTTKVVGLAHAMLPDSTQVKNKTNAAKFVDTAIDLLVEEMLNLGAVKKKIVAKLAGGAQMFVFTQGAELMRIGHRNVEAARKKLESLNIPIISEDTGGNYGRTVELDSDSGMLLIRTIGYGIKQI
ncbi:chemotaxis protein CheD [Acetivibrio straminisolvens]|jgi:chemotaxis protein CheD|uniref:Probable chemoreceptor glutamine deamidase CheD n=1 Tax=Acetivibrio straminisolvens JCM 21531 TaxID=1294263 RepID=W4V721_9FIRM|nr:chemotaxis protein CheD [Acetivibrio straminisolvens]GAE88997.1 chemotaxis protein CheD [Acetivibrio straminisolvens JCM 21531]